MKTFTKFKRPLLIFFLIINSFFYSHASTGDCEGWITDYSGGSLTFTALREGYISFWGNEPMGVSITVSGNDMPYESTVCIVDGMLSNITTMENALGADKKMYIHNNRNWTQMYAIYSTPIVLEGEVINTDLGNNQFTIEYVKKNSLGGASFGGDPTSIDTTITIDGTMMFKHEGAVTDASGAIQTGRHVRVYKARKQTILAFTPDALEFNHPWYYYNSYEQSFVQQGFLKGYYNGNVYFAEKRKGEWINVYKGDDISQAHMVEGHYMNSVGASARPGDRAVFVPYAMPGDGLETKVAFFRPNDDESIEGYIKSISGDDITIEVVSCPTGDANDIDTTDVVVTLKADAEYHLNGNAGSTQGTAIQVGNYVRVLKEWTGAVLARDINTAEMTLSSAPQVKPFFISDYEQEITMVDDLWQQPDTIEVTENHTANFQVYCRSLDAVDYQWYQDGNKIPGALSSTYDHIAKLSDNGSLFTCMATNTAGTTESMPTVLVVNPDTSALLVAGTSIADKNTILISYNKEVQVGEGTYGAENVANYSIDQGITIDSITLIGDKKTVVLKTSDLTSGNDYTITINNVQDVSFTPNQIADNTTTIVSYKVKFRYLKFTMTKKGSLNPKVEEMRYIEKGTEYGTGKAYWGEGVSNPEEAFDANGGTVVSMGTNDVVGLDMGIGFEIAPDSIKIQLDKSNGRNIEGFRVEGSNDYTNWTLLFEADTFLVQGATHYIAFDLSALDPDSILTGAKSVQVIDFPAIGDQDINNSPINLNATASSGLPVTYYVLSGPGSVSSDQLTLTDTGEVWIRATQDGDDNYYSAYPVEQTFMVYGNITNQKEFIDTHKMSVYPVPADKYINVSGVPEGMTVRLYNINGVLLKSEMSDGIIRMDISDLNKGLYLLKANGKVCKIIKK